MSPNVSGLTLPHARRSWVAQQRRILALCDDMWLRGAYDNVRTIASSVGRTAIELDAPELHGEAMLWRARSHCLEGAHAKAAADLTAALQLRSPRRRSPLASRESLFRLFVLVDAGELAEAEALAARLEHASDPIDAAIADGYRGNLARALGRYAQAHGFYAKATAVLGAVDTSRAQVYAQVFEADRAAVELLERRPARALTRLRRARRALEALGLSPQAHGLVAFYEMLARRALGMRHADDPMIERLAPRNSVRFIDELRGFVADGDRMTAQRRERRLTHLRRLAPCWDHARLALGLIQQTNPVEERMPPVMLLLDPCSSNLSGDDGIVVDLRRRAVLARMAQLLAEAHARSDDRFVSCETLVAEAWPGERMDPRSAKNRLHVAISTLRGLIGASAIQSSRAGYAFDPRIELRCV